VRHYNDLKFIIDEYPRLILGGKEGSFVKKCCYSIIMEKIDVSEFPPPLFIEDRIEVYFQKVIQVTKTPGEILSLLESLKGVEIPFLFYETEGSLSSDERDFLGNFLVSSKSLILSVPFPSLDSMEEFFSEAKDRSLIGFKPFYLSPFEWKEVR